jgi:hypothetical protein
VQIGWSNEYPSKSKEIESQNTRLIFRFILFTISKYFAPVKLRALRGGRKVRRHRCGAKEPGCRLVRLIENENEAFKA